MLKDDLATIFVLSMDKSYVFASRWTYVSMAVKSYFWNMFLCMTWTESQLNNDRKHMQLLQQFTELWHFTMIANIWSYWTIHWVMTLYNDRKHIKLLQQFTELWHFQSLGGKHEKFTKLPFCYIKFAKPYQHRSFVMAPTITLYVR